MWPAPLLAAKSAPLLVPAQGVGPLITSRGPRARSVQLLSQNASSAVLPLVNSASRASSWTLPTHV